MRVLLIFFVVVLPLRADTLTALAERLGALDGSTPISASIVLETSGAEGEGDQPMKLDGRASATIGDGPEGVSILFSPDSVARAERELHVEDGEGRDYGSRLALGAITAKEVREHLNAAPYLLRQIGRSELVEEKDDVFEGQPARLLVLNITPRLNPQAKKFIKHANVTARIWLGSDGMPVGAQIRQERKGRALLVISFEAIDDDTYRYRVIGDRLVVVHHTRETSGSGAGQKSSSRMVVELKPAAPAG